MIELLILFQLSDKVLTMYGVSKEIKRLFSAIMLPSYGTIKPALQRLTAGGFVKTQKTMSSGGRPSVYYSITKDGLDELKRLILLPPLENPIQFLTTSRIKLYCAGILNDSERKELFKNLKIKAESIMIDTKSRIETDEFFPKMVFENLTCEYKNFISLLEGLEHAGKN